MDQGSPPIGGLLFCIANNQPPRLFLCTAMERYTYLLLDLLSIAFPLMASFEKRLQFWRKCPGLFVGIAVMAAIFIPWDIVFTARSYWGFNDRYLIGIRIAGLPLEEWLFFLMIPYSCIFLYEVMKHFVKKDVLDRSAPAIAILTSIVLLTIAILNFDRAYTSITFVGAAILLLLHALVFRSPWLGRFFIGYAVSLIPFLIVNGMLTGSFLQEPVVWYNNEENLGIRLTTIPIEDSIYLLLMLLIVATFHEAWDRRRQQLPA
jgi:lycopene cyclase domain-containing protein